MDIKAIEINDEVFPVEDSEARQQIQQLNTTIAQQEQTIQQLQDKLDSLVIPVFNNTEAITITDKITVNNPNIKLETVRAIKQFGWVHLRIYGTMTLTKTSQTQDAFKINDERFYIKNGVLATDVMTGYAYSEDWQIAIGRITIGSNNVCEIGEQGVTGNYNIRTAIIYPAQNP